MNVTHLEVYQDRASNVIKTPSHVIIVLLANNTLENRVFFIFLIYIFPLKDVSEMLTVKVTGKSYKIENISFFLVPLLYSIKHHLKMLQQLQNKTTEKLKLESADS